MTKTVSPKSVIESVRIGGRLRSLRKAKRYTLRWVATEMGISESMLCYLEKGQRCWTDKLERDFLKAIEL